MRTPKFTALPLSIVLALGPLAHYLPACTSIMVGKKASVDGSVMTSHTCDSHRTASQVVVVPSARYEAGAERALTKRCDDDAGPMARYGRVPTGKIPQVADTFGYIAPAYAAMNQRQLAIGESTFDGREELKSDKGLIDCETLTQLMLERAEHGAGCDPDRRATAGNLRLVRRRARHSRSPIPMRCGSWRSSDRAKTRSARCGPLSACPTITCRSSPTPPASANWIWRTRTTSWLRPMSSTLPRRTVTGTRKAVSRFASTRHTIPTGGPVSRRRGGNGGCCRCWPRRWSCTPTAMCFPFR